MRQTCFKSKHDLMIWREAFSLHFPSKAHLTNDAATLLAGFDSYEDLLLALPENQPDAGTDDTVSPSGLQPAFLSHFVEYRRILVRQIRITPEAAHFFLMHCHPEADEYLLPDEILVPLMEEACYYTTTEPPEDAALDEMLSFLHYEAQALCIPSEHEARGNTLEAVNRLCDYPSPAVLKTVLSFVGESFALLAYDDVVIDTTRLGMVVGSVSSDELGDIPVIALPYAINSYCQHDQYLGLSLRGWGNGEHGTALFINSYPSCLKLDGNVFTYMGFWYVDGMIAPLFLPPETKSPDALIVESVAFSSIRAVPTQLADNHLEAFRAVWASLRNQHPSLPANAPLLVQPDGWCRVDLSQANFMTYSS